MRVVARAKQSIEWVAAYRTKVSLVSTPGPADRPSQMKSQGNVTRSGSSYQHAVRIDYGAAHEAAFVRPEIIVMRHWPPAVRLLAMLGLLLIAIRTDFAYAPNVVSVDGGRYVGEMLAGKFHGQGTLVWPDGTRYVGEFSDGLMSGVGRMALSTGESYVGQFKLGMFNGKGRYVDADGDIYEGDFARNAFTGHGTHTNKAGVQRTGTFEKWRLHGHGVHTTADGTTYVGEFTNGMFSGKGTLKYAATRIDSGTENRGTWRDGKFEETDEEVQTERKVELALEKQGFLLDKAFAALAPSEPGKINMYFLAVAGDGTEPLLRREVQFVQEQFDREFGTRDRSIALINSRTTTGFVPMATVSSIGASLKTIASRMDRDKDILFLYLNSHGTEDHKLVLDQKGMALRDLSASELGGLLKESGIRWKVIVISACYSGGFIDAVRDDTTLVITDARHDRNSFGLSDAGDFSYFGRAFFKESLPMSPSFTAAFTKTEVLIRNWENKGVKQDEAGPTEHYSYPQLRTSSAINKQLERWRATLSASTRNLAAIR
jgi:hypothetical protein